MSNIFKNKIAAYLRSMQYWSAEKVANFLKLHKNKTSKVYKALLEYANVLHVFDVSTKRVALVE